MWVCLSIVELKHIVTPGKTLSRESPTLLHFLQWLCLAHFLFTSSKCALQAINLWVRFMESFNNFHKQISKEQK